jgi:hypothetical protein
VKDNDHHHEEKISSQDSHVGCTTHLETLIQEFKEEIHIKLDSLHLELIRQLHLQKVKKKKDRWDHEKERRMIR